MKILSFPLDLREDQNPYHRILYGGMDNNVAVTGYKPLVPLQSGDVFHIHWLEYILKGRFSASKLARSMMTLNFIDTVKRVKRNGVIAWTVHNLEPHEEFVGPVAREWSVLFEWFLSQVDVAFALSAHQLPLLKAKFPRVNPSAWVVAEHPHYREFFLSYGAKFDYRSLKGISNETKIVSMIGHIRPYKGILEVVDLFLAAKLPDVVLLIAGPCGDRDFLNSLQQKCVQSKNIILDARKLSNLELVEAISATDVALFNFKSILNSGSILAALSLNRLVLSSASDLSRELQARIGGDWVHLFDSPLTIDAIVKALEAAKAHQFGEVPNLDYLAPKAISQKHLQFYKEARNLRFK